MLFLTDSCFWLHARELMASAGIDLRPIMTRFRWGITAAVRGELVHHDASGFVSLEDAFIVPVSTGELERALHRVPGLSEFDTADQTLIVAANRDTSTILTDDGGLLMFSQAIGVNALLLPQFFLSTAKAGLLQKNTVYKALRVWDAAGRYKASFLKAWRRELAEIRGSRSATGP